MEHEQRAVLVVDPRFGDGGKGKGASAIIDLYDCEVDVRFNGGANTGRTIVLQGKKFVCKVVPIGTVMPNRIGVIGPYVLLLPWSQDPSNTTITKRIGIVDEVEALRAQGVEVGPHNLIIDLRSNLTLPWHLAIEEALESGTSGIGSTRSGVGPTYGFLHMRQGIRVVDCLRRNALKNALEHATACIRLFHCCDHINPMDYLERLQNFGEWLAQNTHLTDSHCFVKDKWESGSSIVYESAQGLGLCPIYGTVPFTSASFPFIPEVGGFVPHDKLTTVIIRKAYETRVGKGPFLTKIDGEIAERIREKGNEYGASTLRPRDVGWMDAVATRYAASLAPSRDVALFIVKLDILEGIEDPLVCCAYDVQGTPVGFPAIAGMYDEMDVRPIYIKMPTIDRNFYGARDFNDIPKSALEFVRRTQELVGVPVRWLSTSPDAEDVILLS